MAWISTPLPPTVAIRLRWLPILGPYGHRLACCKLTDKTLKTYKPIWFVPKRPLEFIPYLISATDKVLVTHGNDLVYDVLMWIDPVAHFSIVSHSSWVPLDVNWVENGRLIFLIKSISSTWAVEIETFLIAFSSLSLRLQHQNFILYGFSKLLS